MNFEDLDKKMRVYEQSLDQVILPDRRKRKKYFKGHGRNPW